MSEAVGRIKRVRIRNYKSLADVDVELEPLTVLVGKNGSGKSNFVDALMFMRDCLSRNGSQLSDSYRQLAESILTHPMLSDHNHIEFVVTLTLPSGNDALYAFSVEFYDNRQPSIVYEQCRISIQSENQQGVKVLAEYIAHRNKDEILVNGDVSMDRKSLGSYSFILHNVTGHKDFQNVRNLLCGIREYDIRKEELQKQFDHYSPVDIPLDEDGRNAGTILHRISRHGSSYSNYESLCNYLGLIIPHLRPIYSQSGSVGSIRFVVDGISTRNPTFDAKHVSDGTLRVFGILLALFQAKTPPLISIEEPEMAVHPGAVDVLVEAFTEASQRTQILITTHSPDLLDCKELKLDQIRIVEMVDGVTRIGKVGDRTTAVIRKYLSTPGEMLKQNQFGSQDGERDEERWVEEQHRLQNESRT